MNTKPKTRPRPVLAIAAAAALLAGSSLALAGPEHPGHGGKGYKADFDPARQLSQSVKRLDLSDDQREAIQALFEANREDLLANREAGRELREELEALMREDTLDTDALADLAEREGELAEERILLGGTLASEVLAELDADQRDELAALRDERQERRRARFSGRKDREG
ncbi:MAG: periplasmic heavy metal sensor [Xanthomonadales bacterium]|nr:periplasmic heavy metal sensor [Xanthomonadales bacterium]